jgi:hypothetical protein
MAKNFQPVYKIHRHIIVVLYDYVNWSIILSEEYRQNVPRNAYVYECKQPQAIFGVLMAMIMKNIFFWDVTTCGSCKNQNFGGVEHGRISELETKSAVTSVNDDVTSNIATSSLILFTLMMGAILSSKSRFLQEPHGVTYQKTAFLNQRQSLAPLFCL